MTNLSIFLFEKFETLDAMGPAEVFGSLPAHYAVACYSLFGGPVRSTQGVLVDTLPISAMPMGGVLLIPGGRGTRGAVADEDMLVSLAWLASAGDSVLTVCTGSGLLARTGLLDGRRATGNKISIQWTRGQGPDTQWQPKARWVQDGKFWTSSGVSAGIDMALAFVAQHQGRKTAEDCAAYMEYVWNDDPDNDPFAREDLL